jgi:hypothetical protein
MSMYVAIPGYRNLTKKEAEKILKYKDLIIENQRMWNVKATGIPVENRDFTTKLMHNFLYSTIVSYHAPLHVSSVTALILRRTL